MPARHLGTAAPQELLEHLRVLREELEIPESFPPAAEAEAADAARTDFDAADRTGIPFVTIDPPGSRDLDQALHIERRASGYRVHYAIAAVGRFIHAGGPLDLAVQERGVTVYGPAHSFPLHPLVLSAQAASLLPDQVRPSYLWTIDLDEGGATEDARVEFAMVRSRAQLTYQQVQDAVDGAPAPASTPEDLPRLLKDVGVHRQAIEAARGGVSLDIPEQEVARTPEGFELTFRATLDAEGYNAQISLLTGIEAAKLMREAGTGIFRTLPEAENRDVRRLRHTARALGLTWHGNVGYPQFVRSLDSAIPAHAAFLDQATTLFRGSGYEAFTGGAPGHALPHGAIASEYAHVTAPLRRLVDRCGLEICLAHCEDRPVPEPVLADLDGVPRRMAEATSRAGRYERGAVDVIEALILEPHRGEVFRGVVVDVEEGREKDGRDRGRIMIAEPAAEVRIVGENLPLGEEVSARLVAADPETRQVRFELVT